MGGVEMPEAEGAGVRLAGGGAALTGAGVSAPAFLLTQRLRSGS
jgi:hypothetical protein